MSADADRPTRRVASYMLRHVVDFLSFGVHNYQLSVEEAAMVSLVAVESTRPIVDDLFLSNSFGFEREVLPDEERKAVTLKFVYTTLGINRETARRKMERLVERGFVARSGHGFILPEQTGGADYTKDLRTYLLKRFETILSQADRVRGA